MQRLRFKADEVENENQRMGQELNQAGEVSKLMEIKRKEQLRLLAYQQKQKQK